MSSLPRLALLFLVTSCFAAQDSGSFASRVKKPLSCNDADVVSYQSSTSSYICTAPSTGSIPTGSILLIDSGSCPTGFAEVAALNGKTIIGTLAANADVGTTGGADNITPTGTVSTPTFTGTSNQSTSAVSAGTPAGTNNAPAFAGTQATLTGIVSQPTFTGSALATHAHELPWQIASTTTIRQIAVATFGTGTSRAATAVSAAGTANTTSAAVALSQAVSAGTPAGTVSQPTLTMNAYTPAGTIGAPVFTGSALVTHSHTLTPAGTVSQPTFTGSSFDNRSAYERLIFCKRQ